MNRVLLCTDGSAFARMGYQYATWLYQRMPTAIEILHVTDQCQVQTIKSPDFCGNLGIDGYQRLLNQLVELEHESTKLSHKRAQIILDAAEQILRQQGVVGHPIMLTHDTGLLIDCFHQHEANADLIMLGKWGETAELEADHLGSDHLGSNVERTLRASHTPCLVTPKDFQPIHRVLFAYDGSRSGQKALQFLVESPLFKGLELHVITVTRKRIDDAANAYLQTATVTLKSAGGFRPTCHVFRGNPEDVIVEYAENQGMNCLVMGAHGHNRISQRVLGKTTVQVLQQSNIPVFLFR